MTKVEPKTFDLPSPGSFIPAKSPLIRRSPRQQKLLGAERRQVQSDILAAAATYVQKKSGTEKKKKERKEKVFYLRPMMTKATSKVFLTDGLQCLCRASNRYQNFLVWRCLIDKSITLRGVALKIDYLSL